MTQTFSLPRSTQRIGTHDVRRQAIAQNWTPAERRARAESGRRRRQQLATLLFDSCEEEIWAVGAPAAGDLSRLAG